jgi:AraC family transcriptional regulator, regulatory protein of adaptative response / methylated-DNA-[protein]-cysteine methyltransferase
MSTQVALPMSNTRIDADIAWQQLIARNSAADFFYAVTTTGVFCRPTCKSRRPLRANIRFFASAAAAQAAGFRACRRCKPLQPLIDPLARVRVYIERNVDRRVRLDELGRIAGMSPFTVQRLFKQQIGLSPLAYQRSLRASNLRVALRKGARVTDAVYEAGYSSPSRAWEGAPLGMTPAKFAQGGKGEHIGFTTARTPFGWMVVGATERGLCWLALGRSSAEAETSLREEFPAAAFKRDPSLSRLVDAALMSVREGSDLTGDRDRLELDLRGTVFQLRVWQALRQIPRGVTMTYSQLARELGNPDATRAVARACATNRVAVLVPCHRVVGVSGSLTGYRWGTERKRQLLAAETT